MSESTGTGGVRPRRIVLFGITGSLGQEMLGLLDDTDWPIAELVGVASEDSVGADFEFRGERRDVLGEWPALAGADLVLICTRGVEALEIVRDCLRAEVPCLDLTGALSAQAEVPLPAMLAGVGAEADPVAGAPLIAVPGATALAWHAVLSAIGEAVPVQRAVGTVLCSASALGQEGLVALSEETIALFNQSDAPGVGPAGQGVAFDVVPGGGIDCDRARGELGRLLGPAVGISLASLQIPTFVGEGTSLSIELTGPLDRAALEARLEAQDGISLLRKGRMGGEGLQVVEEGAREPMGPTLRDAAGLGEILVGRIESDPSLATGQGYRLWLVCDPIRVVSSHGLRVAARRLGLG